MGNSFIFSQRGGLWGKKQTYHFCVKRENCEQFNSLFASLKYHSFYDNLAHGLQTLTGAKERKKWEKINLSSYNNYQNSCIEAQKMSSRGWFQNEFKCLQVKLCGTRSAKCMSKEPRSKSENMSVLCWNKHTNYRCWNWTICQMFSSWGCSSTCYSSPIKLNEVAICEKFYYFLHVTLT